MTPLYPKYATNKLGDWLGQAGLQHQLYNYANYLGITLPVVNQEKPVTVPQAL